MKIRMTLDGACISCGSEDVEHAAKGKCRNCYMRDYMRKKREDELSTEKA
jgi:hypothetical protein